MKNLYTFLILVFAALTSNAQIVNIPDANFKAKLLAASPGNQIAIDITGNYFKIDANNDGNIQLTEAQAVYVLDVSNANISDLTGITSFDLLQVLTCSNNQLSSLELGSLPQLETVICDNNALTSINSSGLILLSDLICPFNLLSTLDVSHNPNLIYVDCDNNSSLATFYGKNGGDNYTLHFENDPNLTSICVNIGQGEAIQNLITSYGYTNCTWYVDCTFTTPGQSDYVATLDANFKAKLLAADVTNEIAKNSVGANIKIDTNNDGNIQKTEALAVYQLDVNSATISNLAGIESFINLTHLNCALNQLSELHITNITHLKELRCMSNQLSQLDVTGLNYLKELWCGSNQLTSLNLTGLYSLEVVNCTYNLLQSFDASNHIFLQRLHCNNNQITNLTLTGLPALSTLYVGNNQLTNLNVIGLNLYVLDFEYNQISSINVTQFPNLYYLNYNNNVLPNLDITGLNLKYLYCRNNQITALNLSACTALTDLDCSSNLLTSLNVSGLTQLQTLLCSRNTLANLDVTGLTHLDRLDFYRNAITSINLTGLNMLTSLRCVLNNLTALDLSSVPNLNYLDCGSNPITTLDLSVLSNLARVDCTGSFNLQSIFAKNGNVEYLQIDMCPSLQYICADEQQVAGIQAQIISSGNLFCHVNSYCSFVPGGTFYTVLGSIHFDGNNNGCDAGDAPIPNVKFSFSDGTNISNLIANETGNYHYDVQSGTQTFFPVLENPNYFNVSPASAIADFSVVTSPFLQNFCIASNGNHQDLEVALFPTVAARPGADVSYKMVYKNKGTTIQSGTINLLFNDDAMDLVSANPINTAATTNNLTWNFLNLHPFETREILVTMNINTPGDTPPVNSGDVLHYTASINAAADETPEDNSMILNQTVVNSFDPNDKTCIEGVTVSSSVIGKYVHYIIRFENTGSANAKNIVVKDMIDTTKYDIDSLIALNGSASYTTKITNTNQVEFIFEDINLSFDDAHNDGYVAFKIKTKPTLVVGDSFSNSANIYFDYNFPVVTNTATTTIAALGTSDFVFNTMFGLSPVPVKDALTITTKQDVVISSVSVYNMLGQLVQVNANPNKVVDVSGLKTGNYCIKIVSDKGAASTKFVKE